MELGIKGLSDSSSPGLLSTFSGYSSLAMWSLYRPDHTGTPRAVKRPRLANPRPLSSLRPRSNLENIPPAPWQIVQQRERASRTPRTATLPPAPASRPRALRIHPIPRGPQNHGPRRLFHTARVTPGAPRPTRRAGPGTKRAGLSGGRWECIVTLAVPSAVPGPMGAAFLDGLVASRRVWAPEQAEPSR